MKSRYLQYDKKESSKVIGTLGSRSCERSVVRCDIGAGRASGRAAGMVGIGGGDRAGCGCCTRSLLYAFWSSECFNKILFVIDFQCIFHS